MGSAAGWATAVPSPPLAPFVDGYVGYRAVAPPSPLHRGLPSRHLTFIVSIGSGIDVVAQTDPDQAPASYRLVVSGLQASSALIAHGGHQEGVAIELTPLGCRALFGEGGRRERRQSLLRPRSTPLRPARRTDWGQAWFVGRRAHRRASRRPTRPGHDRVRDR